MDRKVKEAIRYLGYGRNKVDEATLDLIDKAFNELCEIAKFRFVYKVFPLKLLCDNEINIGGLRLISKSLSKNLNGCNEAIILACTLGTGVDTLMRKAGITNMAYSVVLQAAAAALLEEELDIWQSNIKSEFANSGKYIRPRFSPGYSDVTLDCQGDILAMLEAPKKIGLSLTDGNLLTPIKSVTAIIGVSDIEVPCRRQGCEECEKKDCGYRR